MSDRHAGKPASSISSRSAQGMEGKGFVDLGRLDHWDGWYVLRAGLSTRNVADSGGPTRGRGRTAIHVWRSRGVRNQEPRRTREDDWFPPPTSQDAPAAENGESLGKLVWVSTPPPTVKGRPLTTCRNPALGVPIR